jgi:hypothetical protein
VCDMSMSAAELTGTGSYGRDFLAVRSFFVRFCRS